MVSLVPMIQSRAARAAAVTMAAAMTLTGCSILFPPKPTTSPTPSVDYTFDPVPAEPGAPAVYSQKVEWEPCGEFDCATVLVPLNWDEPDGETIEVAINRHRARNVDERVGNLLINPGGPGGSGKDMLEYLVDVVGERLLDSYDIIGVDPRGVGGSTPMECGTDKDVDEFLIPDFAVETQDDLAAAEAAVAAFAAKCRESSGPVVEFMDTASSARDLDVIRAVLGDEKLHFLGFSYGTQLGATYMELYPANVGRMVLDGAVDLKADPVDAALFQARGFEKALANFIDWCYQQGADCPLPKDKDAALQKVADIVATARDRGFISGYDMDVNGNLMVYGIIVTLYDEGSWEYLMIGLDEVINAGTASIFYQLANFYLDRDPDTGAYLTNQSLAFQGINCLDAGSDDDWTLEDQLAFREQVIEASPRFGWWFASGMGCEGWPWAASQTVTELVEAKGAGPALVIGTTEDPATPYAWAQELAADLGAPLLTWVGEGHTAYGRSNQCVIDVVDAFLVDGVLPADGTRC